MASVNREASRPLTRPRYRSRRQGELRGDAANRAMTSWRRPGSAGGPKIASCSSTPAATVPRTGSARQSNGIPGQARHAVCAAPESLEVAHSYSAMRFRAYSLLNPTTPLRVLVATALHEGCSTHRHEDQHQTDDPRASGDGGHPQQIPWEEAALARLLSPADVMATTTRSRENAPPRRLKRG
jgi:hypothetical protein